MFTKLTFEKFLELSSQHKKIGVYMEIPGDQLTPVTAYLALKKLIKEVTLLETSPKEKHAGRYSYLCFDPMVSIQSFGNNITIEEGGSIITETSDPFELLKEYQKKYGVKTEHPLSRLLGGMLGFMSYDAIRLIEKIPNRHHKNNIPDLFFRFYNSTIVFDHQTGKVVISTVAHVDNKKESQKIYDEAIEKIHCMINQMINEKNNEKISLEKKPLKTLAIEIDIDDVEHCKKVNEAKEYIKKGDVFQVVLSRKFSAPFNSHPFKIYRALRFCSPSPYMFYLEHKDFSIAGASPEKLVSVHNGLIESCPLAGTRPRRPSMEDDDIAQDLLSDEKEVAEHMMLVDLARNDVGSIAVPGSVKVTKLKKIEKFSRVMHISSTVNGTLREDKDILDALKAAFPAGTLSGAPKIRAMEIIDELENSSRGIYGGAICVIDNQNNLDSCIAIRMAFIADGVAHVRAGGGVVFDSDPQSEADETRHKARTILEAIALAGEM